MQSSGLKKGGIAIFLAATGGLIMFSLPMSSPCSAQDVDEGPESADVPKGMNDEDGTLLDDNVPVEDLNSKEDAAAKKAQGNAAKVKEFIARLNKADKRDRFSLIKKKWVNLDQAVKKLLQDNEEFQDLNEEAEVLEDQREAEERQAEDGAENKRLEEERLAKVKENEGEADRIAQLVKDAKLGERVKLYDDNWEGSNSEVRDLLDANEELSVLLEEEEDAEEPLAGLPEDDLSSDDDPPTGDLGGWLRPVENDETKSDPAPAPTSQPTKDPKDEPTTKPAVANTEGGKRAFTSDDLKHVFIVDGPGSPVRSGASGFSRRRSPSLYLSTQLTFPCCDGAEGGHKGQVPLIEDLRTRRGGRSLPSKRTSTTRQSSYPGNNVH